MDLGSFTGIRIGISTIKAICDVTLKPCVSVTSLEALAYTCRNNGIICSLIDAKHSNIYAGIFEYKNGRYTQINNFTFCSIDDFLLTLNDLKKKIFFVGNCGILYKDMIKSFLKDEVVFLDDTLPTSKNVGVSAFDKYNAGIILDSFKLPALYLKKSSAEEKN